jgi:site-specific recombinase XerD
LPYEESPRQELATHYREGGPTDFLFTSAKRKSSEGSISVRGVLHNIDCNCDRAQLTKHACLHTLRHCFAVH